jgi:2-polyprenyl-6-methoxyphenol hydroxylase-like FAD-dependent oxidoreductase
MDRKDVMLEKSNASSQDPERAGDHAVVIGSSISGLLNARVLADYFERVTLIDRDWLPGAPELRRGVPQARHAHTLHPRGQQIMSKLFPGLIEELIDDGAVAVKASQEIAIYEDGQWKNPRKSKNDVSLSSSRPLLETAIYCRIISNPRVSIMQGYDVVGLLSDERKTKATGVHLRSRRDHSESFIKADLIVDSSGRNSKAPQWLEKLGYTPPEEWSIDSFVGYATRTYRQPANFDPDWKTMYIRPTPPGENRGGIILPLEDDRWHVTLIGVGHDYPPTDEDEFLEFARSLPTPRLYEAIQSAEPLSQPSGYRRTKNQVRRYEKLPAYLENFLVSGDAVFAMNPMYALGMTAAAVGSQALDRSLLVAKKKGHQKGMARAFQKRLCGDVGRIWRSIVSKEWEWSATQLDDNTESLYETLQISPTRLKPDTNQPNPKNRTADGKLSYA